MRVRAVSYVCLLVTMRNRKGAHMFRTLCNPLSAMLYLIHGCAHFIFTLTERSLGNLSDKA